MSFEIRTTIKDGDRDTVTVGTFGGSHDRLVAILGKQHHLTHFQRRRLKIDGKVSVVKKGLTYTVEIARRRAEVINSRQTEKPFIIVLKDGTEVNWNALADVAREEFRKTDPEFYERVEAAICEANQEETKQ